MRSPSRWPARRWLDEHRHLLLVLVAAGESRVPVMLPDSVRALEARFWAKVDRRGPDDCWPWRGYLKPTGYGYWTPGYRGRNWQAHRLAFALANEREAEHEACHTCDNRACCNPAHLYDGTHQQNVKDSVQRGRRACGERAPAAKLTEAAVRQIRAEHRRYKKGVLSGLANRYGISRGTVLAVVRGETWSHVR